MKAIKNILVVVNPISGNTSKEDIITTIIERCNNDRYQLAIYETTGENDISSIKEEIIDHKVERILVVGGDGTIKIVAEAVEEFQVSVGIIPAGSANGLAVNFNIPPTLKEQLDIALGDNTIKADKLLVNNHVCFHMADLGINAELVKNYEASNIRGKLGYILQTVPTLFSSEYPFTFKIEVNSKTIEQTGIMLCIANANKFGTGATVNPNGKINDGVFELLVFKELNISEIINTIYNETDLNSGFAKEFTATSAKIKMHHPVPLQIDGEFIESTKKVKVKLCEKKLTIAVPKSFVS
ncbi:diacylglycerol/lipid kinase family protein [Marixanthomonas ophiurae]|uniref:YegS/Rv2252/BmrU family lipid kinase n=1 Tax=Marixanthomonas ophiurae TaxID=387659 RepID=A0A3E1QDM2_9FLAO|nr:YegS/Rv2252/BmrU family lipid kinase [Marixanthomonas ophiurae]RFN60156.1 YegS/Rv2252/BmrU family lipid kinase [Marixanthomonas ophiurae]